jgi:hypothetical protein
MPHRLINPVHILPPYFPKIHSNIILPSIPRTSESSLPFKFSNHNVCYSLLSHACYMPLPSHPPWFNHPNNIWWSVQVMELLIIQCARASHHSPNNRSAKEINCHSFFRGVYHSSFEFLSVYVTKSRRSLWFSSVLPGEWWDRASHSSGVYCKVSDTKNRT